ncbi:MAG: DEAD/DEAH box helicase [Bacteroidota bacterium]
MFTSKKLYSPLAEKLSQLEITEPTAMQRLALPKIKSGSDVFVISPKETGKSTLAVIYLLHKLKTELEDEDIPRAIVVVPTKEKVLIFKELLDKFGKYSHLRVLCAYTDDDLEKQRNEIYKGADIVVGTGKRLGELYTGTGLNLKLVNTIVVDDFDEINKQDALTQTERILVANPKVQKLFFATTQPALMKKIIEKVSTNLLTING